jgi:ABC-type uncharacterized transport system auxiliary subunit
MKRQYFISLGLTGALLLAGCGSEGRKQFVVAFSQANNAEPTAPRRTRSSASCWHSNRTSSW